MLATKVPEALSRQRYNVNEYIQIFIYKIFVCLP